MLKAIIPNVENILLCQIHLHGSIRILHMISNYPYTNLAFCKMNAFLKTNFQKYHLSVLFYTH